MLLVGGFGASDLLKHRVQATMRAFPGCKLITPTRPAVAVEFGAVLFGLSQAAFASRVSRFTYGVASSERLCATNPKHHNPPSGALSSTDATCAILQNA